jgi:hypothetical protein
MRFFKVQVVTPLGKEPALPQLLRGRRVGPRKRPRQIAPNSHSERSRCAYAVHQFFMLSPIDVYVSNQDEDARPSMSVSRGVRDRHSRLMLHDPYTVLLGQASRGTFVQNIEQSRPILEAINTSLHARPGSTALHGHESLELLRRLGNPVALSPKVHTRNAALPQWRRGLFAGNHGLRPFGM